MYYITLLAFLTSYAFTFHDKKSLALMLSMLGKIAAADILKHLFFFFFFFFLENRLWQFMQLVSLVYALVEGNLNKISNAIF